MILRSAQTIVALFSFYAHIAYCQPNNHIAVDKTLNAMERVCLSGKQYSVEVDAKGNIIFKNFKPGVEASGKLIEKSVNGAIIITDQELRRLADNDVRKCMEPYLPRLVNALLGPDTSSPSSPSGPLPPSLLSSRLPIYKATASSEKNPQFGAQKAIDGKARNDSYTYSWWTREGETVGAWINLHLDRPSIVREIAYFLSFKHVRSQIRSATLQFDDGTAQRVQFELREGWQRVPVQSHLTQNVLLTVNDVFPIGDIPQLQVLELELYGNAR